jgi:hypothetical protein
VCDDLKPCDWSTLGLSSVNRHPPEHHWHNPRNMSLYNPRNLSCYYQYEEYVKQVEVKQSAEVDDEKNADVISRLIYYSVKTLC